MREHAPQTPPRPAPRPEVLRDDGRCGAPEAPVVSPQWRLAGYRPGGVYRDVVATGRQHEVLVASTSRRVCVSRDWGATWTDANLGDAVAHPVVHDLPILDATVVIAQGTREAPTAPLVFFSRDDTRSWTPLPLPDEARVAGASVITDHQRTLWAIVGTRIWRNDDGRTWQAPKTIPGTAVDQFDACGAILTARITRGELRYFHRSDDGGATWRPLRLGHLGIDGGEGIVRCLGWNGALEAGRAPLPTHWSLDGGRTWERARYDERARVHARAIAEDPTLGDEAPRCTSTSHGELVCIDAGRFTLPNVRERRIEVNAPAGCDRVRLLDNRHAVAFGPSCGFFVSNDRGGVWQALSVSVDPARARRLGAAGRGGFAGPNTVWRVDDALWWSDDAGERWQLTLSPSVRALTWGVFTDRRRGVFMRNDGWAVTTRDGGETWTWLLHEDVERIARAGSWLSITTPTRVRVSPDGGLTWRASLEFPANLTPEPTLQLSGTRRWIDVAPRTRVVGEAGRIEIHTGDTVQELIHGLMPGWELLAAHVTNHFVDRVLLAGGAVLRLETAHQPLERYRVTGTRPRPR